MFIKCGRLCCLCLKQCGINLEAAHIFDKHKGGSDDEDNGIPLCFDCHQEIGGYNKKHPKGNKFSTEELKAKRNRVYSLVDSGAIYAQIIAEQVRARTPSRETALIPESLDAPKPSSEGKKFLEMLLKEEVETEAPARRLKLLSNLDSAFVIDELLSMTEQLETAIQTMGRLSATEAFTPDQQIPGSVS